MTIYADAQNCSLAAKNASGIRPGMKTFKDAADALSNKIRAIEQEFVDKQYFFPVQMGPISWDYRKKRLIHNETERCLLELSAVERLELMRFVKKMPAAGKRQCTKLINQMLAAAK